LAPASLGSRFRIIESCSRREYCRPLDFIAAGTRYQVTHAGPFQTAIY
jgi:hypothetical protein